MLLVQYFIDKLHACRGHPFGSGEERLQSLNKDCGAIRVQGGDNAEDDLERLHRATHSPSFFCVSGGDDYCNRRCAYSMF